VANVQHVDLYAGENRTLTLNARDSSNAAVSLAGKTITFRVGQRPAFPWMTNAVFTKTGTATVTASGTYTVPILPADTQYLGGEFEHQTITTDGSGVITVVNTGRFKIRKFIEA
jgi:hypothetical protein